MPPSSIATSSVAAAELRAAMARFASGVSVITARNAEGQPVGTTVSAVASLSLDPPLVLACLDRGSRTLAAVRDHGAFAVNVLGAHHQEISGAFARSANHAAWDGLDHAPAITGSPLLTDAHVALDCQLEEVASGGDHEILIGRVVDLRHGAADGEPLVYYGGRYAALAPRTEEERAERRERARAQAGAVDCALPTRDGSFRLLAHERTGGDLTAALVYGDPASHPAPVISTHVACLLGDALGSLACDCGDRLRAAQEAIVDAGAGVLLYTKRSGAEALHCSVAADSRERAKPRTEGDSGPGRAAAHDHARPRVGPDRAVGAGLLARLGVRAAL